ncbi:hypothetical protein [Erythrobacter rubeus]|uniref:Lipoprotein n=1 Tax=Erythrobacter rubeus TaxID=2760803 RepID=A0ABR8KPM9_9SPHN|nr:hypothetical protein [Erythrobacter rubeus]MBD2842676.1 hypothetical protein [Erythrobacter rubeus]
MTTYPSPDPYHDRQLIRRARHKTAMVCFVSLAAGCCLAGIFAALLA